MTDGVLVANRGEVALRIIRGARVLGLRCVAVHTADERDSSHVRRADDAVELAGTGAQAYLDTVAVVDAARTAGCRLVHPGYGFLSESSSLARACDEAHLTFVGPHAHVLDVFGDKRRARSRAVSVDVPVLPASEVITSLQQAHDFMDSVEGVPVMVKAVAGGGGRGIRMVEHPRDLESSITRCRSEAFRGFGVKDVFLELRVPHVRHIEIQVVGDGDDVTTVGDRDCSLQLRRQKVIEIAPAPALDPVLRTALHAAARALLGGIGYRGLATVEFLVDPAGRNRYWFLEVNPRLQVEHGVTEEVAGIDLVATQLRLALGDRLADLSMTGRPTAGLSIEARVTLTGGDHGRLSRLELPTGPGVRVESHLESGSTITAAFDPLLAKVIVSGDSSVDHLTDHLADTLERMVIQGVDTNMSWLVPFLRTWSLTDATYHTGHLDEYLQSPLFGEVGGRVTSPTAGSVVDVVIAPGRRVCEGEPLVIVEAMKMEHEVRAPASGVVVGTLVSVGDQITAGAVVLEMIVDDDKADSEGAGVVRSESGGQEPESLTELRIRKERILDAARPEDVAKRHSRGARTARENIADLFEDGSLLEYGGLVIAAQRRRRSVEELEIRTPADGLVMGVGRLRHECGGPGRDAVALAYDYTVLAGTQGLQSHRKAERMIEIAERQRIPLVLFAEGGGGRPGDTDNLARATGMDLGTFTAMARLHGCVPTVGIASGRCFAGNAVLLGLCDLVIATVGSTIGLGGPAMIEAAGLGSLSTDDVGPADVQSRNGVIDVLVADEAEATEVACRYLGYFHGSTPTWTCGDQAELRTAVPEKGRRVFEVRTVINQVCDDGSTLELGRGHSCSAVTAFGRVEGHPVGIIANDCAILGGAIDGAAAEKFARFLELCGSHRLPVVSLCDTPGFMVGPASEETGAVRLVARMLRSAARLPGPFALVILRRAYGLGGQAMAGGSFRFPTCTLSWPTGDIGAMGPRGAARLGYSKELSRIPQGPEREAEVLRLAEEYKDIGRATHAASVFEVDDVIDPADTRRWISRLVADRGA